MRNVFKTSPFRFNAEYYNFWPIYLAIKQYYPIGIKYDEEEEKPLLQTYPGLVALGNIIDENLINQKNYRERWVKFRKFLHSEIKKPVQETTIGLFPSFSGLVQLKRVKEEDQIRLKELHFAVSLIGPFYTLFGMDKTILLLDEKKRPPIEDEPDSRVQYEAIHVVTASPYEEYEEIFKQVQQRIAAWFSGYKFVPYAINNMFIEGLRADYAEPENSPLYNVLFNNILDMRERVRGNQYYGYDEWKRKEK